MINWVKKYFPEGTKMAYPKGGVGLWIELSGNVDTLELNEILKKHNIGIAPGKLFSAAGKYKNCLRLNYAKSPDEKIEAAVKVIGEQAKFLIDKKT